MAANEMAKDPRNANSDFIPPAKRDLILHASPMIGPTRTSQVHVLRFTRPAEPGIYPFVCTFPGHWVVMNGEMVVAKDLADVEAMLAARQPAIVKEWKMADFAGLRRLARGTTSRPSMRGMQAFVKARCNQCHVVAGHGVNLGPDLAESVKTLKGEELLRQMLEPSSEIHEKFQNQQFVTDRRPRRHRRHREGGRTASTTCRPTCSTPHTVTRIREDGRRREGAVEDFADAGGAGERADAATRSSTCTRSWRSATRQRTRRTSCRTARSSRTAAGGSMQCI